MSANNEGGIGNSAGANPVNILSFDVEDRFHVDGYDFENAGQKSRIIPILIHLLDILDEYKARATFFVLGEVAQKFPEIVALIDARGHEVASHGQTHGDVIRMPRDRFGEGLRLSKELMEDILRKPVDGYKTATPLSARLEPAILENVAAAGYRYCYCSAIRVSSFTPNVAVPAVTRDGNSILVAGQSVLRKWGVSMQISGRLRTFPAWFMLRAITALNKREHRAIINLKLWELDGNLRRAAGSDYTDFTEYGNLSLTEEKLSRILLNFEFSSFAESLGFGAPAGNHADSDLGSSTI